MVLVLILENEGEENSNISMTKVKPVVLTEDNIGKLGPLTFNHLPNDKF